MRVAVIGSGIVGMTIARELLNRKETIEVTLFDSYSIPGKGTSRRNSGVMHAGLYYEPNSLKARVCRKGRSLLNSYIEEKRLNILKCGKLLVPQNTNDIYNMEVIYANSQQNGCETQLVDYKRAKLIQPGIVEKEVYLWSPNTYVFSPGQILETLKKELEENNCKFEVERVVDVDVNSGSLYKQDGTKNEYDFLYNTAGPEALEVFKRVSDKYENLLLLPFLGEYGKLLKGPKVKTNLYPVPDPKLPFLGIHVTPQCQDLEPIIGPNAIPYFKQYIDEYSKDDLTNLLQRGGQLASMFLNNRDNFRKHAWSEVTLAKNRKFKKNAKKYFSDSVAKNIETTMSKSNYGIRPQLVDISTGKLINDFKLEIIGKSAHVVNAVSPAFTSSMELARYIIEMTL